MSVPSVITHDTAALFIEHQGSPYQTGVQQKGRLL